MENYAKLSKARGTYWKPCKVRES